MDMVLFYKAKIDNFFEHIILHNMYKELAINRKTTNGWPPLKQVLKFVIPSNKKRILKQNQAMKKCGERRNVWYTI